MSSGEPTLADVAAICGEEGARALAEAFGGKRLYIPRSAGADHYLSAAMGADCAARICAEWGGTYLDIPCTARRRLRILELKAQGLGPIAIQRRLLCSRRLVFKVLAQARDGEGATEAPSDQPRLL